MAITNRELQTIALLEMTHGMSQNVKGMEGFFDHFVL